MAPGDASQALPTGSSNPSHSNSGNNNNNNSSSSSNNPYGVAQSQQAAEDAGAYKLSAFFNPWDPPPQAVPPPSDPELQKRIDKLAEYAAKNGPKFESVLREKQNGNPAYAFLNGGEGYGYYRYMLWIIIQTHAPAEQVQTMQAQSQAQPQPSPSQAQPQMPLSHTGFQPNQMFGSQPFNPNQLHPQPAYFNQPSPYISQPFTRPPYFNEYQQTVPVAHGSFPFPGNSYNTPNPVASSTSASAPATIPSSIPQPGISSMYGNALPLDVASEASSILDNLSGTKESIKNAKAWFMQKIVFASQLGELFKLRVFSLSDSDKQLHILYLLNDILFNSLQNRTKPTDTDPVADALKPSLGPILSKIYHSPTNSQANQERLRKILGFWGSKELYSMETIQALENEMLSDSVANPAVPPQIPTPPAQPQAPSPVPITLSTPPGTSEAAANTNPPTNSFSNSQPSSSLFTSSYPITPFATPNLLPNIVPNPVLGLTPTISPSVVTPSPIIPSISSAITPAAALTPASSTTPDQPPYPLFPPGLIPGMVRKMQIGSGVPYSPISPLDIPSSIPPSTVSESYIYRRVAKFFKDINEVDPLASENKDRESEEDDRGYSQTPGAGVSRGGISPPHLIMEVDPETGTLPDGSVETRSGLGSERLGLGASADPMEITQYDDVYSSYRKQRSSNYHSSMSVRAALKYEHS